ncbi:MAG TPA: FAD-dependent oxidoreductase [Caulobacteraceae bacterium]|jgi:NADPH-dependent 2,4-dienoyl-CoA reductase/sulfur reductase-like enzyme/nitrite reductase/ring-hydroxylating ferredoxin subunit
MGATGDPPRGPDFGAGLALERVPPAGVIAGHVEGGPVLLYRLNGELRAIGGACTHYGAPLDEGLVVGETVRCPWHHACFSLRTGEALSAPAFDALSRWKVELVGGMVFVHGRHEDSPPRPAPARPEEPRRVVIVGGGAAGFAAAEMLRRRGYQGRLTMLSAEEAPPCDRPNLSKDYLAGTAPEEWIPLKGADFYRDNAIDLRLGRRVVEIAHEAREAVTEDGERFAYDRLLLATGAEPIRPQAPGFDDPAVHTLRSLADARAIIAAAATARSAAVIGASFIGLETAASLRTRGVEVHVVAPEAVPMERVLGRELGQSIRALHERKGVVFHLGRRAEGFADGRLRLDDGGGIAADLVVLGVGVRPRLELAVAAGLETDGGVLVDRFLETSRAGVFAAGDIARYPDARTGERIRVEHWAAAQRQGQTAAVNMLGERRPFTAPPFFWSNHYDLAVHYVGHAPRFDHTAVDGSIPAGDATLRFFRDGRIAAAASVGRPREILAIEAEMETASEAPPWERECA